jgi:GT2 family glycosyltransferase
MTPVPTRVTAVIPHWNRRELLETLLRSVREQQHPFVEVIVADNGSTDDSAEFAERNGARVLRLGKNFGFAAAVNRGIEAAQSDWIAILNNDVTLDPRWLAELLESAERANAHFATGKILRSDNPAIIDGTFDEISRGACAYRCGSGKPDAPMWNQPRTIRIASMTAAIFRKTLFERVGLLDERFISYLEDTDFGLRCAIAGREGVYEPRAVAFHRGSATLGAWNYDTVRAISRNQVLLAAKHFRGQPRWSIVAGQLLWGLLAIRHARGVAWLAGKFSGWQTAGRAQYPDTDTQAIRTIVEASEREIFAICRESGFDAYWRAYFWLRR